MKDELKSLSLAILLSFVAIYTVNYFFGTTPKQIAQNQASATMQVAEQMKELSSPEPQPAKEVLKSPEDVVKEDSRIAFQNNAVSGSIRLRGSRFDDLYLKK